MTHAGRARNFKWQIHQIDWQKLNNAVDQAKREIANRFDFKGTQCSLDLKEEGASGGTKRQKATFIWDIDAKHCKKINAAIKNQKFKVKSQTMDAKVRVTAKSRDELQKVISYFKKEDSKVPLQFTNYH